MPPGHAAPHGVVGRNTITAIRKTVTAAGCAAVLFATATACGTVEHLTAGQKLDDALDRLGEQKSIALEFDPRADPDALAALMGGAVPGDEMPPDGARFFTGLHVFVTVNSKKPLAESGERDLTGTALRIEGPDSERVLAEYRVVGDSTYYRADMTVLGVAMGFPVPASGELPAGDPGTKAFLAGDWVKVDTGDLRRARNAATGGGQDPGAGTRRKILKAVRGVVAREVTFSDRGGSDGLDRIVAKADLRDLLTGLFGWLRPLTGELPPGGELPTAEDLKDVPHKKVAAGFNLLDGELTRIDLDFAALTDRPRDTDLRLLLHITPPGRVHAPSGATELPVDRLMPPISPLALAMSGS